MKSLITAESKDIAKYLRDTLADCYDGLLDPDKDITYVRGEIFALKMLLQQFMYEYELEIKLVKVEN